MVDNSFLFKRSCRINDNIEIIIPTVEEIIDNEQDYYSLVSAFTSMPIDMMVQLDDIGIDFAEITEYELFQILFPGIQKQDTHLLFGDLDLSNFVPATNNQNGQFVFYDEENGIVIDESIHNLIATTLRKIHHLQKNNRKPGNDAAKDYLIKKERKRLRRRGNKPYESQLEPLIVAMVCSEPYKYDFESTKQLSIYQFNECVRQVIRKTDWNNRMYGIYSGSINPKEMKQDDLRWIGSE
jgi:hypothetical protein